VRVDAFSHDTVHRVDNSGSANPDKGLFEVKSFETTTPSTVTSLPDPGAVNDCEGEGEGHSPGHRLERPIGRARGVGASNGWTLRSSVPSHSAGVEKGDDKRVLEKYGNDARRWSAE
jgi:hypothetical protein